MLKKYLALICITTTVVFSAQIVIDQPGQYGIGQNTSFTPSATDDAIVLISASNVIFDGRMYEFSQNGGSGGLRGIEVASGLENVQIQNVIIRDVTGPGIFINDGCNNIRINTIETLTVSRGIEFDTTGGAGVSNCSIRSLKIDSVPNEGIFLGSGCSNISVDSAMITNVGTGTSFAIQLSGSSSNKITDCSFSNISMFNCSSGIEFLNADNNRCVNCTFVNSAITATSYGFHVIGTTTDARGNNLSDCTVQDFSGTTEAGGYVLEGASQSVLSNCISKDGDNATPTIRGFFITASSQDIILQNCLTLNIDGVITAFSFHILNSSRVFLNNCEVLSGTQQMGVISSDGFRVDTSNCITFDSCKSNNNNDDGFHIATSQCIVVKNCIASCNGDDGYRSDTCIGTIFDSCISCSAIGVSPLGDGFNIVGDTGTVVRNCTSTNNQGRGFIIQGGSTGCNILSCVAADSATGFLIDGSASCSIGLCSASNCTTGFENDSAPSTGSVFFKNNSVNNTTGFAQTSGGNIEYFLNAAANNTTNYLGGIPSQFGQNAGSRMGGNLTT